MIFNGRKFQEERIQILKKKIRQLRLKGRILSLASFYFSDDRASQVYTRLKEKKAAELGIRFLKYGIEIISESDLERIIKLIRLEASNVDGVLVQKPKQISWGDRDEIFYRLAGNIPLKKDVDVVSPHSIGRLLMINKPLKYLWPATVRAVFWVLTITLGVYRRTQTNPFQAIAETKALGNKKVVVIGGRGMVGSLLSLALLSLGAEVFSGDKGSDVKSLVKLGEIVISAAGVAELIKANWINEKQMIIDVGFGDKEGRVVGDFEPTAYEKVKFAAPVPGGVGPLTIISLMENLFELSA